MAPDTVTAVPNRDPEMSTTPTEEEPLLPSDPDLDWRPGHGFLWIQFGMYKISVPRVVQRPFPRVRTSANKI